MKAGSEIQYVESYYDHSSCFLTLNNTLVSIRPRRETRCNTNACLNLVVCNISMYQSSFLIRTASEMREGYVVEE